MAISKQELQGNGQWWTWINYSGFNTFIHESTSQITEQEAQALMDAYNVTHQYDEIPQVIVNIYDNREVIRNAIVFIKTENPNMTQWNSYLATLAWDEAYAVRWFLAMLARELASRKEIDLPTYTEVQVLSRLKTWIINAPARRLEKIVFGM